MSDDQLATLDEGRVNERILAKATKVDFRRVEEAGIRYEVHMQSPEAKRLFVRSFMSFQLNMHFVLTFARMKLPADVVDAVEADVRARLDAAKAEFDKALDAAEALFKANAITKVATYQVQPLTMSVSVVSALGRKYLELFSKLDQLMPVLKTMEIEELRTSVTIDQERARFKRLVARFQGRARQSADGLRRRMHEQALRLSDVGGDDARIEELRAAAPGLEGVGAEAAPSLGGPAAPVEAAANQANDAAATEALGAVLSELPPDEEEAELAAS